MIRDVEALYHIDAAFAHITRSANLYAAGWAGPDDEHILSKRMLADAVLRNLSELRKEIVDGRPEPPSA